jgi:hypothetical protein
VRLFTSRYAARKLILASGAAPIRTSLGQPKWYLGYDLAGSCRLLMPTYPMLQMELAEYERVYRKRLDQFGVEKIREALEELSQQNGDRDLVLLCYEDLTKSGQWCHRRLFASWFEEQTSEVVAELGETEGPSVQRPERTQPTLF